MKTVFLVGLLAFCGNASAQSYGDWSVGASDDGTIVTAETINESGASFGLVCLTSDGDCMWSLDAQPDCEHGATYPIMANTDSGAYSLTMRCAKSGSVKLLVFTDFAPLEEIVTNSQGRVGFAIPMKDGQFRVVRFSMSGAHKAAKQASDITASLHKSSTKDLNL